MAAPPEGLSFWHAGPAVVPRRESAGRGIHWRRQVPVAAPPQTDWQPDWSPCVTSWEPRRPRDPNAPRSVTSRGRAPPPTFWFADDRRGRSRLSANTPLPPTAENVKRSAVAGLFRFGSLSFFRRRSGVGGAGAARSRRLHGRRLPREEFEREDVGATGPPSFAPEGDRMPVSHDPFCAGSPTEPLSLRLPTNRS